MTTMTKLVLIPCYITSLKIMITRFLLVQQRKKRTNPLSFHLINITKSMKEKQGHKKERNVTCVI